MEKEKSVLSDQALSEYDEESRRSYLFNSFDNESLTVNDYIGTDASQLNRTIGEDEQNEYKLL